MRQKKSSLDDGRPPTVITDEFACARGVLGGWGNASGRIVIAQNELAAI
jgi:hypothetical protein